MATGDKKRAVMTDDINNGSSSYPVLGPTGDGSDVTAAFTAASTRTNISTGEKLGILFGKIAKWFTDLGAAAFLGVDTSSLSNDNDHVPTSGVVKSALTSLESDLASIHATGSTNTTGATITKNTYFYLNNVLVQAKADIASGATYTSGTNYEAVTAGGLNDLMSALDTYAMKREDITSLCTWDSGLTFINKFAIRFGDTVSVFFIIYPYNATNPTIVYPCALPSSIKAYGPWLAACVVEPGNGIPVADNAAYVSIADNSNIIELRKTTPNSGFAWGQITFKIQV